jgi:hypothetical protein
MGVVVRHPRADPAWAARRVAEIEQEVGQLLFHDMHGVSLVEATMRLQAAVQHRDRVLAAVRSGERNWQAQQRSG